MTDPRVLSDKPAEQLLYLIRVAGRSTYAGASIHNGNGELDWAREEDDAEAYGLRCAAQCGTLVADLVISGSFAATVSGDKSPGIHVVLARSS